MPSASTDQRPPTDLNRAIMDKYRSLMEKHYLADRPVFS
jgi:hypothetical protein